MFFWRWFKKHRDTLIGGLFITIVGGLVVAAVTGSGRSPTTTTGVQAATTIVQPSSAPETTHVPNTQIPVAETATTSVPLESTPPAANDAESTTTVPIPDPDVVRLVPDINGFVLDINLLVDELTEIDRAWTCSDRASQAFAEASGSLTNWIDLADQHAIRMRVFPVPDSIVREWNDIIAASDTFADSTKKVLSQFQGGGVLGYGAAIEASLDSGKELRSRYGVILEAAGESQPAGTPPSLIVPCVQGPAP